MAIMTLLMSDPNIKPQIKLVCFDLGGVIIRLCQTWQERCSAAGLELRKPEFWDAIDPKRDVLLMQYMTGQLTGDVFTQKFSEHIDQIYNPSEIAKIIDAWLVDEYEGMSQIVDQLHKIDMDTAALTNTTLEHWARMNEFPTVGKLKNLFPSHEVGLHKPDPAIYAHLEKSLGYHSNEILFFDDTQENIDAAITFGWQAIRIDPFGDPATQISRALEQHKIVITLQQ